MASVACWSLSLDQGSRPSHCTSSSSLEVGQSPSPMSNTWLSTQTDEREKKEAETFNPSSSFLRCNISCTSLAVNSTSNTRRRSSQTSRLHSARSLSRSTKSRPYLSPSSKTLAFRFVTRSISARRSIWDLAWCRTFRRRNDSGSRSVGCGLESIPLA